MNRSFVIMSDGARDAATEAARSSIGDVGAGQTPLFKSLTNGDDDCENICRIGHRSLPKCGVKQSPQSFIVTANARERMSLTVDVPFRVSRQVNASLIPVNEAIQCIPSYY